MGIILIDKLINVIDKISIKIEISIKKRILELFRRDKESNPQLFRHLGAQGKVPVDEIRILIKEYERTATINQMKRTRVTMQINRPLKSI